MSDQVSPKDVPNRLVQPHVRELSDDWAVISSGSGVAVEALHEPGFSHPDGHATRVPQTVFAALVEDGTFADPFLGKQMETFATEPYRVPWFYRTEFDLDPSLPSDYVELAFEGFNFAANVWINGHLVGDSEHLVGPFRIYRLDITQWAQSRGNVLVVEVIPPSPGDLTIGWVDWNPYPPDNNLGIWRPVKVRQTGPVSMEDPVYRTDLDVPDFKQAEVEMEARLVNRTDQQQKGQVRLQLDGRELVVPYVLEARASMDLRLDAASHAQLLLEHPRVWWPHLMGDQPLYTAGAELWTGDIISEKRVDRFGVRRVEDYINEQGHRGYKVNGKPLLIRGAGWCDELFLREPPGRVEAQVRYARHMNLNTLRMEGFWGSSQEVFDLCDELGLLLMIGWSCHWEWEGYCGREEDGYVLIKTPEEIEFHSESFKEQAVWLRNHPSVLVWVFAADMIPRPELERELIRKLGEVDPGRPLLAGCRQVSQDGKEDYTSEVSGPPAVKMVGPYSYVTPNYWFEDRQLGGAFGFNTETGPGMQPVVYESLCKFTPEENRWPMDAVWDFHTGKNVFGNFDHWLPAFNARYGEASNAEDFCFRAQMSNYEAIRAMFEAFTINKPEATGVIQWMFNAPLPRHLWQLFDYYLMPTGAFYGVRQACQPVNAIYNPANHAVHVTNDTLQPAEDLKVRLRLLDSQSTLLHEAFAVASLEPLSAKKVMELPELTGGASSLYFLDLQVDGPGLDGPRHAFYWLSSKKDACDYAASDWHHTPNTEYADLTPTRDLPAANLQTEASVRREGEDLLVEVRLANPGRTIAFFAEMSVRRASDGETILPVYWDDNYVSLLPGDSRLLSCRFRPTVEPLGLHLRAMNVKPISLPLNSP